jgi:hypothetical protein
MDAPALREGERLITPRLRPQKGADFIEGAAKACGGVPMLEPAHGAIPLLDAAMILFQHIVEILDLADFDRRAVRLAVPSEGGGLASLPSIVIIRAQVRIISFTK